MKINKIELYEDGNISIRYTRTLFDADGVEVDGGYHRETRNADSDLSDLPPDYKAAIEAYLTPARVTNWRKARAIEAT